MALKVKIFKGYDSTVETEINNFLSTKNLNENKISLTQSYYEEKNGLPSQFRTCLMITMLYEEKSIADSENIKTETKAVIPVNSNLVKERSTEINKPEKIKMKFKDAPVGARFKYPNMQSVWVKINSYPKSKFNDFEGLVCQWNGNVEGHQSFASFVDDTQGIDFDTEVVLI